MKHSPRLGFKLQDFLASVIIALVLFVLLLPGISTARDAARLAQCQANLKQIGLAMHAYHTANKMFPPGVVAGHHEQGVECSYVANSEQCDRPYSANASAFAMILPHLENPTQHGAYRAYNFNLASCSPANATSASTVISQYLCPANQRGSLLIKAGYSAGDSAPLDYGLSIGSNSLLTCWSRFRLSSDYYPYPIAFLPGAGVFNINSSTSLRHFRDGMTRTMMIGEIAGGGEIRVADSLLGFDVNSVDGSRAIDDQHVVDQWWAQGHIGSNFRGGAGSVFAATAFDLWYDRNKRPAKIGNTPGYTPLKLNMNKLKWIRGTSYARSLSDLKQPESHSGQPMGLENGQPYDGKPRGFPSTEFSMSPFRSFHPKACNFLMADGSVQLTNESVDPSILHAEASVSGGDNGG